MSVIDKLNLIDAYKSDIKQAIIDKGVDMTNIALSGYAGKIGEITGREPVVENLNETSNGVYSAPDGVDGYNHISVNVPQEIMGFTQNAVVNRIAYSSYIESPIEVLNPKGYIGFDSGYFPNCVNVSDYAFDNVSVGSISLPNVETIGANAFRSCHNLSEIYLPKCSIIRNNAFAYAGQLRSVNLPSVTDIEISAFQYCGALSYVNLPNCVNIGVDAFYHCGPVSVELPAYMGNEENLNGQFRDAGVVWASLPIATRITRMFIGCRSLQTVYAPNLEYIGRECFQYCEKLQSINSPNCSYIGYRAFEGCYIMSEAILTNAEYVGEIAFANCSSLTSMNLPYCSYISYQGFYNCGMLTSVNMPECLSIGYYCFNNCPSLQTVNLPKCSYISYGAFNVCNGLEEMDLPECLSIGNSCFYGCVGLLRISMPKVQHIGGIAFQNCSRLTEVDAPAYYISGAAFYNCGSLTTLKLPRLLSTSAWYGNPLIDNTSPNFSQLYLGTEVYGVLPYSSIMRSTLINSGVGSIFVNAYDYSKYIVADGWSSLASLFVSVGDPDTPMLSFSNGELYGATKGIYNGFDTTYLTIDKSQIENINLPECEYIGGYNTFAGCENLQSINLPNAKFVYDSAFERCNIQNLDFLPNAIIIGDNAFNNCQSLQTVNLPNATSIDYGAFNNCRSLETVYLPNVTSIANSAFYYTLALKSVEVGRNVSKVVYLASAGAFYGSADYKIYVPASLIDAYKSATNWVAISSHIFPIED